MKEDFKPKKYIEIYIDDSNKKLKNIKGNELINKINKTII